MSKVKETEQAVYTKCIRKKIRGNPHRTMYDSRMQYFSQQKLQIQTILQQLERGINMSRQKKKKLMYNV